MELDVVSKQFKLIVLLLSESCGIKGNKCCFTDCVKKVILACIWTFMSYLVETFCDGRYY